MESADRLFFSELEVFPFRWTRVSAEALGAEEGRRDAEFQGGDLPRTRRRASLPWPVP